MTYLHLEFIVLFHANKQGTTAVYFIIS